MERMPLSYACLRAKRYSFSQPLHICLQGGDSPELPGSISLVACVDRRFDDDTFACYADGRGARAGGE